MMFPDSLHLTVELAPTIILTGGALSAVGRAAYSRRMVQHWTPMHALERIGDEYVMFDRSFRVAIIRQVEMRRPTATLWRSVAANERREDRWLIGYFPTLEHAAAVSWRTWEQKAKPVVDHLLE